MKQKLQLAIAAIALSGSIGWGQTTFNYTGGAQTYLVPLGVTEIHVEMYGAGGEGTLGEGGKIEAVLPVTPGESIQVNVGGEGTGTTGGFNGGGTPGTSTSYGGGGGASDIRQGGVSLGNRTLVAGGGGGSGSNCGLWTAEGGHGGGLIGESGCLYSCHDCQYTGAGGTQVAGGIAGPTGHGSCGGNSDGVLGVGGSNLGSPGTGGGGGYYGGGSGCYEGAGGGSSYSTALATDVIHTQGGQLGHGQVIITELCIAIVTEVSDFELCFGDELTLNGTSLTGGTISWDMGVIDGEAFVPAVGITNYTVTSDSDGDCDITVEVAVFDLPTVIISVDNDEICLGESVIFSVSGDAISYDWTPGDVVDGEVYTPLATDSYSVVGTDINDCESSDEVIVVVNDLPIVTANSTDTEICLGDEITLTGSGASTYIWDPATVDDGVAFAPDAVGTTTYTVEGTDVNDCSNDAVIEVTVYEELVITYTTTEEVGGSDGEIDITVTGGNPTYVFDWDNDGTGDFDDTEDLTGLIGGSYIVVVNDDAGCEATETIILDSQVGITEMDGLQVAIYPNPTSENLNIVFEGAFNYELSSLNGEIILNGSAVNKTELDLDNLAKGVYLVTIRANEKANVVKIVKN